MTAIKTQTAASEAQSPTTVQHRQSLIGSYRTEIAIAVAIVVLAWACSSPVPKALS